MHSFYTAKFVDHNCKSQNTESNQHKQLSLSHSGIVIVELSHDCELRIIRQTVQVRDGVLHGIL
jgi:hypothetical protein